MINTNHSPQLIIRAGYGTLSFLLPPTTGENARKAEYYQYAVKSGMSLSANLREAFREQPYLQMPIRKAVLMVVSPVVLVPKEDYMQTEQFDEGMMFNYVLTGHKSEVKIVKEIPELEAMAIFAVNKDLQMVVGDNCEEVDIQNIMLPVWKHLYNRYYQNGQHRKLFAYFHDKSVDICSFDQRRLRFANSFDAQHAHDALYYMMYIWKQLGLNQNEDDLFIVGDIPHQEWLTTRLKSYLDRVHVVSPSVVLNRSALAEIEGMPFDMML